MRRTASFTISHTTKTHPRLPYEAMKNDILGVSFSLSLVFVGEKRAQQLNFSNRGKTYVPNVLSFSLGEKEGEIYITPSVAKREAKKYHMTPRGYIGFLFIHGLLHLKGMPHGATMESVEKRYCAKYNLV